MPTTPPKYKFSWYRYNTLGNRNFCYAVYAETELEAIEKIMVIFNDSRADVARRLQNMEASMEEVIP